FRLVDLPEISLDGYEADDVLATLAEKFKDDFDIVFVTSDKDYSQLVEERVVMFDPARDRTLDREGVFDKYGVHPEQFVDYLALVGDSSDNIPGVRGIGAKGAEALLKEYGSLDAIYEKLDEVPEKYRKKLAAEKDAAFLSRELAQIVRDVPLELPDPKDLVFDTARLKEALKFLERYEMPSLKRRIEKRYGEENDCDDEEEDVQSDIFASGNPGNKGGKMANEFKPLLADGDNLNKLLKELKDADDVSLDTETDSLDPLRAGLVGISLCVKDDEAWYIPLGHKMHDNLDREDTLKKLKKALAGKTILGHNLKYDLSVLKRHGWEPDNPIRDTMLAAYILDPGTNSYSLDACAKAELNHEMIPISDLLDKKNKTTFDLVDVEKACEYSAEDAWAVWRLYPIYAKRLEATDLKKLYEEIELPLIPVLQRMEENGVSLDEKVLKDISRNINKELEKLTKEIHDYAGHEFNINSTQQLAKVLFEEKNLPPKKKTKSGYSTDNTVLESLAEDYPIAEKLIQYRMLNKLESTYVSALPKLVNPDTGRVHSSFNQTVASTGRLSSSNPNLQNIPIRTELGRSIRKAFIAGDKDWAIMSADYSQIELRLLALMSGDEELIDAFSKDLDIHRQTAAMITGKDLEKVTKEERRGAKTINFGLLYGMGQKKLSRELGISTEEAKEMIKKYFERFPSIQDYIEGQKREARQKRFCTTIFGRRLYLKNINSSNQGLRAEAERIAVNMPIQGSAADLIKIAMIDIDQKIRDEKKIRMILQVHDELVFEVHKDYLDKAEKLVRKAMEDALPEKYRKTVALKTDISHGDNWFEAH
ncbi:MAG: DNA polymerase I, partial [Candidatus Syntrophosphaera sp.]